MVKIEFNGEEIERLYQQFMEHPPGLVKKKLHVIYLKSLGLPHHQIALIARVSGHTVTSYLKVKTEFCEQVKSLLNPKFQVFKKSASVTA